MGNGDVFAVENPRNGELGYCSIMGEGEEEFGLAVFQGNQGYRRFVEIMNSEGTDQDDFEKTIMAPQLTLLMVDRREMEKEDISVISSLGLKFRGTNAWPIFRCIKPGYFPWFLEKDEVIFLTIALERAITISIKVRDNNLDLFEKEDEERLLTCRYRDSQWVEEWGSPVLSEPKPTVEEESLSPVQEAELLLIRNSAGKPGGTWEFDIFLAPLPVGPQGTRPYFPLCFLAVETKLGLILSAEMTEPWITNAAKMDIFIKIMQKSGRIPRNIHVKSETIKKLIAPIARSLEIKIRIEPLTLLDEARAEMENHLGTARKRT
jgi:hypothetical protein